MSTDQTFTSSIRDADRGISLPDLAGLVLGLMAFAALLYVHRDFVTDDTFISLRYARNLAEHGQLVWNLGERAEGYTNFLHVLLSAALIRLGVDPVLAAQSINAASAILLILAAARATRIVQPDPAFGPARGLILFAVAAAPPIAIWVMGGLEAVMVAALLAWGLVWSLRCVMDRTTPWRLAGAAFCFSLAVLTRLDASVFVAGTGLGVLLASPRPARGRVLDAAIIVGIPALTAFAHMAWRFSYYGEVFPLTFYAKAGVPFDIRYGFLPLFINASVNAVPVVILAAVAPVVALLTRKVSLPLKLLAPPLLLQLAYIGWTGGDYMPGARILVPLVAPAALVLLAACRDARRQTCISVSAAVAVLTAHTIWTQPPLKMDRAAFSGMLVADHIQSNWPEGSVIALSTAGSTPYFADDYTYIDMLGLNDPHIAKRLEIPIRTGPQHAPGHSKGDGRYVLDRQPDYIIAGPSEGVRVEDGWFLSDVEMAELDEFRRCYDLRRTTLPYGDAVDDRAPRTPRPLDFTYYERTCD